MEKEVSPNDADAKVFSDDEWCIVHSKEEMMFASWKNLPVVMSFEEYKSLIEQHQAKHKNVSWTMSMYTVVSTFWYASGYASTVYTVYKYKHFVWWLVKLMVI